MQPDLQDAKKAALNELLHPDRPGNVVGVGIGEKNGANSLRIYVVSTRTRDGRPEEVGPRDFLDSLGVETEVIEIGRLGRKGRRPVIIPDRGPEPGASIRVDTKAPNVNSGATGTLGMIVEAGGNRYILGCNHVLAVNGRVESQDPAAKIVSAEFVGKQKTLASPVVYVLLKRHADNLVDCALAQIEGSEKEQAANIQTAFPDAIGKLDSPKPISPQRGMHVKKVGAATYKTDGTIVDVDADLYVDYSFGRFRFKNQIVIEGDHDGFATAGDSGSILVNTGVKARQPVGMVFAASGKYAIACRLSEVKKELEKKLQEDPKLKLQGRSPGKVELSLLIS